MRPRRLDQIQIAINHHGFLGIIGRRCQQVTVRITNKRIAPELDMVFDANSVGCHDKQTVGNRMSCLLYTSPSPRDQRGSRMPSSA